MAPRVKAGADPQSEAERLVAAAGLRGPARLKALQGGANNRVFLVEHAGGRALLKSYFRDGNDSKDRLNAEFGFAAFAWDGGLRQAPRPLAKDDAAALALYEFLDGRPARKDDVDTGTISQAARFVDELNAHRDRPAAAALPPARDSCFSFADHLGLVERRLGLLKAAPGSSALEREANAFVAGRVRPLWERLRAAAGDGGPLPRGQRCLSPSDYGFHNAFVCEGGRVRFYDFEYAGWDDPAKLVADFFSQPAVPIPETFFDAFCDEALRGFPEREGIAQRARRVLPVHRLKWVCLLLNDFLPALDGRRRFALGEDGGEERKARQLEKARRAMDHLENGSWPI